MLGARGSFLPAAAMVGYGVIGRWRLTLDRPPVEILNIVYGSNFILFLHRNHTFLTSDPAAKKKASAESKMVL
jgi:hypothetical protein